MKRYLAAIWIVAAAAIVVIEALSIAGWVRFGPLNVWDYLVVVAIGVLALIAHRHAEGYGRGGVQDHAVRPSNRVP
jgi:hypothetical protein